MTSQRLSSSGLPSTPTIMTSPQYRTHKPLSGRQYGTHDTRLSLFSRTLLRRKILINNRNLRPSTYCPSPAIVQTLAAAPWGQNDDVMRDRCYSYVTGNRYGVSRVFRGRCGCSCTEHTASFGEGLVSDNSSRLCSFELLKRHQLLDNHRRDTDYDVID